MSVDVEGYLRSKNLFFKRATATEVHLPCMFCGEESGKRGRLYVNVDPEQEPPGLFMCHLCGERGALNKLRKFFGDSALREEEDRSYIVSNILNEAAAYYHECLSENEAALKYLKYERGLTLDTIVKHQLGWADGGLKKHLQTKGFSEEDCQKTGLIDFAKRDFFHDEITIPYHVAGSVVQIRGKELGGKYRTPSGNKARMFNTDATWNTDQIVVSEGEFDAMVLEQLGYNVVASPGAATWQDGWKGYFSEAKKVFICFDPDQAGLIGAEKVARHIGPCARILFLPVEDNENEKEVDPSYLVVKKGWDKASFDMLMVKSRSGILLTVHDGYAEWQGLQGQKGLKLGVTNLDARLQPGMLPSQLLIVNANTGTGKGHPLWTEIPTPDGLRRWGDLRKGDLVFGSGGQPTTVLDVYDRGALPTYEVEFSDRTIVTVDGDHLWNVEQRCGRNMEWATKTISTRELMAEPLKRGKSWRFRVPMTMPVQFASQDLPVGPYTLGALIANGYLCGTSAVLTTPDKDVASRVGTEHSLRLIDRDPQWCDAYVVRDVIRDVRNMGLNVKSADKFIPEAYLVGSVEQRVALLQGLMDGDGSAGSGRGRIRYHTTSVRLAADIQRLIWSLGGTARVSWDKRGIAQVCIMIPRNIQPFGTPRKANKVGITSHVPHRAIVSITPSGSEPIRCIRVDAADSLYLIGREYVVTHNTIWLLNTFHRMVMAQPDVKILFVSLEQTRGDWYERANRIYQFYNPQSMPGDCLTFFENNLMMVDKNRLTEQELLDCIDQFEFEVGKRPDVVAVDYLGYWARAIKGDAYERTGAAVMSLKAIAKDKRTFIIAPSQVNRGQKAGEKISGASARDSGVIEETADFLFGLWTPDAADGLKSSDRQYLINLEVLKSRHGGVKTQIAYRFAPLCLAMVPMLDPLWDRAVDDALFYENQDDAETAIWRHRTGNRDFKIRMTKPWEDDK